MVEQSQSLFVSSISCIIYRSLFGLQLGLCFAGISLSGDEDLKFLEANRFCSGINVCCDLVSNSYHIVVRSFVIDLCVLFTFVL